jgi:hypothetical protein
MAYFQRRWVWCLVLMLVCMAWLDLYAELTLFSRLSTNINGPPGGWGGLMLNRYLFGYFGTIGASILFVTLYGISLLYLTNFELGRWLADLVGPAPNPRRSCACHRTSPRTSGPRTPAKGSTTRGTGRRGN